MEWLSLDAESDTPLFDQLRIAVIAAVRDGQLPPGTRLPTVRDLAGRIGLAPNTVARAYRELETAGVVETRGRHGTFVARTDPLTRRWRRLRTAMPKRPGRLDWAGLRRSAISMPNSAENQPNSSSA